MILGMTIRTLTWSQCQKQLIGPLVNSRGQCQARHRTTLSVAASKLVRVLKQQARVAVKRMQACLNAQSEQQRGYVWSIA